MIKNVLKIAVVIFLILAFCFPSIGQVSALDFNASESTGGMCVKFLNSFLTMIDSIITGEDRGTIEYSIYEIEEDDFSDDLNLEGEVLESTGMFLWPIPGFTKVSNQYTYNNSTKKGHDGVDIFGTKDKPIKGAYVYAAADGVITVSEFSRNSQRCKSEMEEQDLVIVYL